MAHVFFFVEVALEISAETHPRIPSGVSRGMPPNVAPGATNISSGVAPKGTPLVAP